MTTKSFIKVQSRKCFRGLQVKMIVKWTWVLFVVVLGHSKADENLELNSIIKDINDCKSSEVEFCMGRWVFKTLKEFSDRPKVDFFDGIVELKKTRNDKNNTDIFNEETFTGRSWQQKQSILETMITSLIWDFIRTHTINIKIPETARAQGIFRTYRRFRRFFLPLLIGVKLKLAAFVPMALAILGILGKGAFLSGNAALFLSGLTIFLRYFYPKADQSHSSSYHHHKYDTTGHETHASSNGGDYGHYHHYHHPHDH